MWARGRNTSSLSWTPGTVSWRNRLRDVEMLKCPKGTLGEYPGWRSDVQGWR